MQAKKLAKNTISSLLFQLVTILSGFVIPQLIIKTYGSEVNGLVNSITQFLAFISFLELGMGAVVQTSLYKPLVDNDKKSINQIMSSAQSFFDKLAKILIVYVIILLLFYPVIINQEFSYIYTSVLIVSMSISTFAQYYFGITNRLLLVADQRGYISYNIQTVTLILNTVFSYILIKANVSVQLVKLTTSIIYLIRPIYLYNYVKRHYEVDFKAEYSEEPIKQKWNGIAQHVAAVVIDSTDLVVLSIFSNLTNVSIYSVYQLVILGIRQLFLSVTNGIQPILGQLWFQDNNKPFFVFFEWIEWIIHVSVVFLFSMTGMLMIPFVEIYTNGVHDANYVQPLFSSLLVISYSLISLRIPYHMLIKATGKYKETQNNFIIAVILNIFISILAVRNYGLIGVAIGTCISMTYQTIWMAHYTYKIILKITLKRFYKLIVIDALSVISIIIISLNMIEYNLSYKSWLALAIKLGLITIIILMIFNIIFYREKVQTLFSKIKISSGGEK